MMEVPLGIMRLCEGIEQHGGEAYLVGGWPHDYVWSLVHPEDELDISEDFDIEVFALPLTELSAVLSQYGRVTVDGAEFSVFRVKLRDCDYDVQVSMPRGERKLTVRERKEAEKALRKVLDGHKDFKITVREDISYLAAAVRREWDTKSIGYRVTERKIVDPFNAVQSIRNRMFDLISPTTFAEDPVRVLRAAWYISRYNVGASLAIITEARAMSGSFGKLTPERVWMEFWKMMKYRYPSRGIRFLEQVDWLKHFPEIDEMREVEQDPVWHPEGYLYEHSLLAMEYANRLAREKFPGDWHKVQMLTLGGLLHDVGKLTATQFVEGRWRSKKHSRDAKDLLEDMFSRMKIGNHDLRDSIIEVAREHMLHINIDENARLKRIVRRFYSRCKHITMNELAVIVEADQSSRPPLEGGVHPMFQELLDTEKEMVDIETGKIPKPLIDGCMIMELLGIKPGPDVALIKEAADMANLGGEFDTVELGKVWVLSHKDELLCDLSEEVAKEGQSVGDNIIKGKGEVPQMSPGDA